VDPYQALLVQKKVVGRDLVQDVRVRATYHEHPLRKDATYHEVSDH